MLFVWDFMLETTSGVKIGLHPNFSNTKIECYIGETVVDLEIPHGPRGGLGGTSGPGTFRYFIGKQIQHTLRFQAAKGNAKAKTKANAKTTATAESQSRRPKS